MNNKIKERDYELISAYLDNQLSDKDRTLLESRLKTDHFLQAELHEISKTRQLLKSLPKLRAPRNYFIQAEAVQTRPSLRLAPIFGIVSAVASVVLALVIFGSSFFATSRPVAMAPAAQKVVETQVVQQEIQRSEPVQATPTQEAPMTMLGAPPEATSIPPEEGYKVLELGVPTPTTIYLNAQPPTSTPVGSATSVEELNEISSFLCDQYYDSGNYPTYAIPEECASPTPTLTSTSTYSQTIEGLLPSPSATATQTETPSATPTSTPSATPTPTETPSPTATPSPTSMPTMMAPAVVNSLPSEAAEAPSELSAPNTGEATGIGAIADQQQAASTQPSTNISFLNYLLLSVEISLAFIAIVAGIVAIIFRIKAGR
jgi:hypothetical protein